MFWERKGGSLEDALCPLCPAVAMVPPATFSIRMLWLKGGAFDFFPSSPPPDTDTISKHHQQQQRWEDVPNNNNHNHNQSESRWGDFPGGPVVKTLRSQCRGPGFDP